MKNRPNNIEIVKADKRDLDKIFEIEIVCFSSPWSKEIFLNEFKSGISNIFIAKESKKILGFIVFWIVAPEMHILNIAVRPDCRRQGVASKLLDFSLNYAKERGTKISYLEVRESNTAAKKMYEKFGYVYVTKRASYYQDGEDAIILALALSPLKNSPHLSS